MHGISLVTIYKNKKGFIIMGQHLKDFTIYAVDFDGTLCEHNFPDFGAPNEKLIEWLIEKRKAGDKVILWTNRMGEHLEAAIDWCKERGLTFDAINENIPEIMEMYKDILKGRPASPKITADVFIDDAACGEGLPYNNSKCKISNCWNKSCNYYKECSAPNQNKDVTELEFSARLCNLLCRSRIYTLYDLAVTPETKLRKIHGIGDISIYEIRKVLEKHGFKL